MARQIVGEIFLNVKPLDGGVSQGVQKIIDSANDQAAQVPVTADTAQAEQAVARLGGQIEEDVGQAWAIAAAQAAAFTASVLGARRVVEGLVNKLAGVFDQLAQAQAGFTAILGSEQSGTALLDEIREFARVSPFVTQELVNYSQQLLGVGKSADSIVPLLQSVGDVVASVGGDTQNISRVLFTLTQIQSIGRLVGQDAIQLQSALIPITKILSEELGITTTEVKKLQEQGRISADTVFQALTNAGQKVEGAMANATRNIGGARAVLNDTIEILAQDSEGLRKVFDDIVKGILSFSNALGENDTIVNSIAAIDVAFTRIYESLEPFFEGLSSTSAAFALSSLEILTSSLELLAGILDAFPAEALDLMGKGLALLVALKAPLALVNYVTGIQKLAATITPANISTSLGRLSAGITGTGVAAERAAQQVTLLDRAATRAKVSTAALTTGLGLATVAGGLFASSMADGNRAVESLGGTLQGAGIGLSLGGLKGAAIGAGVGFVASLITGARGESEKRAAELQEIGKKAAESFYVGFNLANPGGFINQGAFEDFFDEITSFEIDDSQLNDLKAQVNTLRDLSFDLLTGSAMSGDFEADIELGEALNAQANAVQRSIDELQPKVDARRAQINELLETGPAAEALQELQGRLAELSKASPAFIESVTTAINELSFNGATGLDLTIEKMLAVALATGQFTVKTGDSFQTVIDSLGGVGLSIETLLDTEMADLIVQFDEELPSAVRESKQELDALKLAFDEASKGASEFFGSFGVSASAIKTAADQTKQLSDSLNNLVFSQGAQSAGFAEALLANVNSVTAANEAAFQDKARAIDAGLSFAAVQFETLQSQLGLTDIELRNLLDSMGLLDLYLSSLPVEAGFTGSIRRLASETGIAETRLREILNLSAELERGTTITITADVEQALAEIARLMAAGDSLGIELAKDIAAQLDDLAALGGVRVGGGVSSPDSRAEAAAFSITSIQAAERASQAAADAIARAQEQANRDSLREQERLAAEAQRAAEEALREQERLIQAIENAGSAIENSVEQAADAIRSAAESWTASITERTEFERAVSASRLIGNTSRQVQDLDELNRGIEQLVSRGLSPDAISAIGIDNVADLRQVRRLLNADPSDLRQLSNLIAQRDTAAQRLAERQQREQTKATITAAIVDAARLLGVNISPERAAQITAQINVTGATDPVATGQGILDTLLNAGQISRN